MDQKRRLQALENHLATMVREAREFADGDPSVEWIWLYLSMQDGVVVATPIYRVDGIVTGAEDLDQHLGTELDVSKLQALWRTFFDETEEVRSLLAASGEVPTRIIVSFDAQAERLEADFNDESIEDPELSFSEVADRWQQRLAETGDASA
ncbi:hypothetical protein B0O41_2003 [Propionibacteriaceae bacterium ES.041]|uniref:DUF600 family protein n=1 Tax=Enemella evansiae TaxID=2016499 RepID=A0A255G3X2_9ACTN|nr:hypothetical protein CGZ94_16590 [Enemella evansiae]PFG67191.1 hypothetical protein B0O41_2003 [Propionibacteriaceae bacterium ES.041]TDO93043.1 hypothetical protein C8D81_0819 [Enemella evansiae]